MPGLFLFRCELPLRTAYSVGRNWNVRRVVTGEDTTGQFPLHDSRWYLAYQIAYNLAIIGAVFVLIVGPKLNL